MTPCRVANRVTEHRQLTEAKGTTAVRSLPSGKACRYTSSSGLPLWTSTNISSLSEQASERSISIISPAQAYQSCEVFPSGHFASPIEYPSNIKKPHTQDNGVWPLLNRSQDVLTELVTYYPVSTLYCRARRTQ